MSFGIVYVTVGTTKFDSLIRGVTSDSALKVFKSRGCRQLILQLGTGTPVNGDEIRDRYGIEVDQYEFKFERSDIIKADLIIGHGGAGTCMDILNNGKRGLIVVNRELMNNHQLELAIQLALEGYIHYCDVSELSKRLETLDLAALQPYEPTKNMEKFVDYLNRMMASKPAD